MRIAAIFVPLIFCISALATTLGMAEERLELPRYKLQVGQELVYRGNTEGMYTTKHGGGRMVHRYEWNIWVIRQNEDASCRLLVRWAMFYRNDRDSERNKPVDASSPENSEKSSSAEPRLVVFAWCDFHPDGRVVDNDSLGHYLQLHKVFPQLPATRSAAEQGWKSRSERFRRDEEVNYRVLPGTVSGLCDIEMTAQDIIYGAEERHVATFDAQRGLPEKIVSEYRQTYYWNSRDTGAMQLAETRTHSPEFCQQFWNEVEPYFLALRDFEATERCHNLTPSEMKSLLESTRQRMVKLGESAQTKDLKPLLAEQAEKLRARVKWAVEDEENRVALLGTACEDWRTTDMAGNEHALKNYRGKVLILDWWYRGCGWCIRAMPQMNEITSHFKGKPVVVLGMNTDETTEDAQIVMNALELNYTNLRAGELPLKKTIEKFGWPTLMVVDQQGVIRDIHIGYSPMLKDDLVKTVERLLAPVPK